MNIIVAGKLVVQDSSQAEFIQKSIEPILQARQTKGCVDFSVSPDPVDANRINIFEKWASRADLEEFRESGPDSDIFSLVESFDVHEYEIESAQDSD